MSGTVNAKYSNWHALGNSRRNKKLTTLMLRMGLREISSYEASGNAGERISKWTIETWSGYEVHCLRVRFSFFIPHLVFSAFSETGMTKKNRKWASDSPSLMWRKTNNHSHTQFGHVESFVDGADGCAFLEMHPLKKKRET